MEIYSAGQAFVSGHHFIWYVLIVAVILLLFYKQVIEGYRALRGDDQNDLAFQLQEQHIKQRAEKDNLARWKINLDEIILNLKHDSKWMKNAQGEALMVNAILHGFSYVKTISSAELTIETVHELENYLINHPAFIRISGETAQAIANRNQLAVALSLSDDKPSTAALIIPGEIYPGTVFGKNNPMVLWINQDAVMELQAAAAFSHQKEPVYFAMKNEE